MKKVLKIIILFLFILAEKFSADFVSAANPLDVIINEIAWMGTDISYNDEWIELYNNTDTSINLDGWSLKAADGTPEIALTGTISSKNFYLLERTNDESVPKIPASQTYAGALSNKGENLGVYDSLGNLIDSVNCGSGWFEGNNKTKQTMERISNGWQTSQNPGGTPKAKNSIVETEIQETRPSAPIKEVEPPLPSTSSQDIKNLAAAGEQIPKSPTPLFVLFIASIAAIFSGTIILALKNKIKNRELI